MKRNYYSLEKTNQTATINIYGDITSWAWEELGEVSAVNLSKQLDALGDVNEINVYINSYGGEVAEGLAIYNALKRHKAKVTTCCDGFACSIASVIFMAGDERVMNESSLLMIHNAWTYAMGNADELRKQADDLEKITQASVEAYKAHSALEEADIKELMDNETWILPEEALTYGFATKVEKTEAKNASQNAFKQLANIIKAHQKAEEAEDDENEDEPKEPENEPEEPETTEDDSEVTTEDDSTEDDSSKDDEPEEEPEEKKPATQKMCGFFNAILNL